MAISDYIRKTFEKQHGISPRDYDRFFSKSEGSVMGVNPSVDAERADRETLRILREW